MNSNKVGKVGWFKDAKYPDGTQVAGIAALQEYGYTPRRIPPRPFFRPTIRAKQNEWKHLAFTLSKRIIAGSITPHDLLHKIGLKASGQVRKAISNLYTPALAYSTIKARINKTRLANKKGRYSRKDLGKLYKPLIDTGLMYGTLINVVEAE